MFKPIGEVRNKTADETKDFIAANPGVAEDPNKAASKSVPIKAKNPRTIVMPTSKTASEKEKQEIDFGIFNQAISDKEAVLDDGEFVTLDGNSDVSSSVGVENPSKGRTDNSYVESLKQRYTSGGQSEEPEMKKVASVESEKIASTFDKKLAQIKALEQEILGFKTSIDQDFNGEWIVYRYPTTIVAFDPKDSSFISLESGLFMDSSEDIWYLNTEGSTKYLVHTGSLIDAVGLRKPANYDIIKENTPGSGLYSLEGSDLYHILKPEYMKNFGIKTVNAEKNIYTLETYTRQELQNLFISSSINIFITEI